MINKYIIIFLSLLLVFYYEFGIFIGNDIFIHYQIIMNFTDQDVQKQKSAILKLSRKKLRSPCIISEYLDDKYPYIQKNSIEVLKSIYKKDFGYNIKYMVNPSNPLDTVYGDFMNQDYYRYPKLFC